MVLQAIHARVVSSLTVRLFYDILEARGISVSDKLERVMHFAPEYKGSRIMSVRSWMIVKGSKGAVQLMLLNYWFGYVSGSKEEYNVRLRNYRFCKGIAADLGYHSLKPMYEGQSSIDDECWALDGRPCYYDGSGLAADPYYKLLKEMGEETVWKALESYYRHTFSEDDAEAL